MAEARARGFSDALVNEALAGVEPRELVISEDRNQAEVVQTLEQYCRIRVSPTMVERRRVFEAWRRSDQGSCVAAPPPHQLPADTAGLRARPCRRRTGSTSRVRCASRGRAPTRVADPEAAPLGRTRPGWHVGALAIDGGWYAACERLPLTRGVCNEARMGRRIVSQGAGSVTPDKMFRWHRRLIAQQYAGRARRRRGQPLTPRAVVELVVGWRVRIRRGATRGSAASNRESRPVENRLIGERDDQAVCLYDHATGMCDSGLLAHGRTIQSSPGSSPNAPPSRSVAAALAMSLPGAADRL